MSSNASAFTRQFFHGTRADLTRGDVIVVGHGSNYRSENPLSWVCCTGILDAAIWGAELAIGREPQRIYVVEPTGPIEDDPNVIHKKFPGNPTLSYRSHEPLRVVAELLKWLGHLPEQLKQMKDILARLKAERSYIILD